MLSSLSLFRQSTEVGGREAAARQLQLLLEQELRIEEAELRKEN